MKTLLCFALLFVLAAAAYAQTPAPPAGKQPVATIGGQPVYEDDLLPVIQPQLQGFATRNTSSSSRRWSAWCSRS